ncbi:hypothetical protein HMPREF1141_1233 [Clostridium sp. MSTE9]|nr:hypothetical protein HMPREF1141_1233 [Clostridium sp. MSTE9]
MNKAFTKDNGFERNEGKTEAGSSSSTMVEIAPYSTRSTHMPNMDLILQKFLL